MNLFRRFIEFFKKNKYPSNLRINGRKKLPTTSFKNEDKLFRSFVRDDLDENEQIKLELIPFRDISCNWSRFSIAKNILFKKNARPTDGCYSFAVATSRYEKMATPVHDPINDKQYPNYSHVEVRALKEDEDVYYEPPKKRRRVRPKSQKQAYRQNLLNALNIEFDAT